MAGRRIVWTCQVCELPVEDGAGYIHIDVDVANARMMELRLWQVRRDASCVASVLLADLVEMPGDIPWMTHHSVCDPRPDGPDYWGDVEGLRTMDQLLRWSLHVSEKNWVVEATDWREFAAAAVDRFQADRLHVV